MGYGNEEEVAKALVSGNFSRAVQLAEEWLHQIPLEGEQKEEREVARFAYIISRFFLNRQERLAFYPSGAEKARYFLGLLGDLEKYLHESGERLVPSLYQAARVFCHSQIADGFAKDFRGQKAYNLNTDEIVQLALSLLEIENIRAAEEVLIFLYQLNPKSPLTLYLLAYAKHRLGQDEDAYRYFREAMLYRPEVISQYPDFLPGGVLRDLYRKVSEKGYDSRILQDRYFALFAELYNLYPTTLSLPNSEIAKIAKEYDRLFKEYNQNPEVKDEIFPRLAHYLSWLIGISHANHNFDEFDEWRKEMISLSPELWEIYSRHHPL
ncbi:MAG: hypothetical protein NZM25_04680 [Leptospiraceae bacterium]|nr:hypothetical protein [Leptospiraceae bacterium]MDW8305691.1 hypothetical protein [Leptospiraceae bacterium]